MLNIDQREFAPLLEKFPDGIVAIDLETTGLSPLVDEIIELAAIKISPQGIDTWHELIDPQKPIPAITTAIHGITDEMVQGKPILKDCLSGFFDFVGGLTIVAHNAKFDLGFIMFGAHQLKVKANENTIYCSVKASRKAFPEMENHKLGTLAKELNLSLSNHHRATDDALACLELFNKAMQQENWKKVRRESYLFNLRDFAKSPLDELPEKLRILAKKAENQVVVDIKYKGGSHKGKYRPVKPISLLPMPGGSILYGLCLLSNLHKSFSLSKIQDVKELRAEEISQRYKDLENLIKKP